MMIIRVLGNLIIFATFMLANVQLHVDDEFIAGDAVTFSIKAQGEDIEFPPISTIENFDVHKNGSSNNITIINGKRSEHRVQSYKFFPNKSVVIPAFKIMIDGQEVFTKEHNITQKKIQKTKSNKFDLKIEVNKSKAFVGEDVKLVLRFKYAKNANILDLGFNNPVFENFWSKQYGKPKKYQKNGFIVQELTYLLFPQKKGLLKINPVKIDMILSDPKDPYSFLGQGINKRLYSNDLQLEVDALPDDVALIGKFKLKSKVNKRTLKSGEATAYSITVEGRGNIDDLDDVKLDIPNVTIYENKAEQKYNVDTNGNYGGVYTKSFSIVAQDDFVIPSIEISYLDKKSKQIKTIKSKSYTIKVQQPKGQTVQAPKQLQKLETPKKIEKKVQIKTVDSSTEEKAIFFVLGMLMMLILGLLMQYILKLKGKKQDQEIPLLTRVKRTKTKQELLKTIVAQVGMDERLDHIIFELEANNNSDIRMYKKEIIKFLNTKTV